MRHFGMSKVEIERLRDAARRRRAPLWRRHDAFKRRHPFAGLRFFYKCSNGRRDIAARHWPTSLTWSWLIGFNHYCKDDHSPPSTIWPTKWQGWIPRAFSHNSGGQWSWGPFRGAWQEEMPHFKPSREAEKRFIDSLTNGPKQADGTGAE
jgi:hypothetical protein